MHEESSPLAFFMVFCIVPRLYHNPLIASNTPFYGILCGMQRIGIFGGSFNPVHSGHLGIARRAVEELSLDRLLFVPAKVNPFKVADGAVAGGLSDARRWELVRLVADLDPRFEAWDFEIRQQPGPSYAIDTVLAAEARFPGASLFYIIGEDNVAALHQWKDWDLLSRKCTFVPYPRTRESSTEIRRRLLAGEPVDDLVPPCVAAALGGA